MSARPLVVTITCKEDDGHLEYVLPHLSADHVVIDPERIIDGTELSYKVVDGKLAVSYNNRVLRNVVAVWYRKPKEFDRDTLPVHPDYTHYAHSALQRHWHFLRSAFEDALWVSNFFSIMRAESKVLQLQLAAQIGFNTPPTLFTSDTGAVKRFIQDNKGVLVKSASAYSSAGKSGEDARVFFATKLKANDASLTGLNLAPAIFQKVIEAEVDIRVTVVGQKVFAAAIVGSAIDKDSSPVRDWKVVHYDGEADIIEYELPDTIADLCVAHCKALGLKFGAIDLVKDKQGEYWFIENNPNGQWAFVQEFTKQPIGKAIAELLESDFKRKTASHRKLRRVV